VLQKYVTGAYHVTIDYLPAAKAAQPSSGESAK
jgi:zinc protease